MIYYFQKSAMRKRNRLKTPLENILCFRLISIYSNGLPSAWWLLKKPIILYNTVSKSTSWLVEPRISGLKSNFPLLYQRFTTYYYMNIWTLRFRCLRKQYINNTINHITPTSKSPTRRVNQSRFDQIASLEPINSLLIKVLALGWCLWTC